MAISDWFRIPDSDATDPLRRPRQSKAEREERRQFTALPVFPWDLSMDALNQHQQQTAQAFPDAHSQERQAQGMFFEKCATLYQEADLDVFSPLSCSLLARPMDFVDPDLDNSSFAAIEHQLFQQHESNSIPDWPLVLLDGHIKSGGGVGGVTYFRPSGHKEQYPIFGDHVPSAGSRAVVLLRLIVTEKHRGPCLSVESIRSWNYNEYFETVYRRLPGQSLPNAIYFFDILDYNFYNFRIPNLDFESWSIIYDDFDYLTRQTNLLEDSEHPEWKDREARFTDILSEAIPNTQAPGTRLLFEQVMANLSEAPQHSPTLPAPRLIKNPRDAELYAAQVMTALGFTNAVATNVGADGGVDVESLEAVAQVKLEGRPSTSEQLQRLYGISAHRELIPLFFSLNGYTSQALQWAEETGMALFESAYDGAISSRSTLAERLMGHGTH